MKSRNGQVQLSELIFTQSWEDPESDREALRITPGDVVMSVTSGGCNTLGFLLQDPARVFAVDINPAQTYLLELKMAAMRELSHDVFVEFLGLRPSPDREALYQTMRGGLSSEAAAYWDAHDTYIQGGVLGCGRYERFISLFRRFLRLLQGQRRIEGLFEQQTPEDQQRYFEERWDTRRFRAVFQMFFNKHMLAHRGLSADYFQFDDGATSFADSFYRRTKHALSTLAIQPNYFVAQYLLGRYLSEESVPDYLRPESFPVIRSRLDRIQPITADAKLWLALQDASTIDCFSLSNICELMNLEETDRTFSEVARTATPGARICFRNLMIPRTVPDRLTDAVRRDAETSRRLLVADRSFVYSRVDALEVAA